MLDNLPNELKNLDNFIVWRLEDIGKEKPAKIPYNPDNHWKCAVTKKENFASFHKAKEVFRKSGKNYSGVGIGLFPAGLPSDICVVDFDGVLDGSGELLPQFEEIQEWIEDFNTYTEVSQSKTGLHLFFYGNPPGATTRKALSDFPVEIYCKGRFIAVTGEVWHGYNQIRECQATLESFYFRCFGKDNPKVDYSRHEATLSNNRSDETILKIISHSKNAAKFNDLFSGNGSDDNSANDQALANMIAFYTQDYDQIVRIMKTSGLVRDKWENHKTYLKMTIDKAITGLSANYDWAESDRKNNEYLNRNKEIQPPPLDIVLSGEVKDNHPIVKDKKSTALILESAKSFINERYKIYRNEVNGYIFIDFYEKNRFVQLTDRERSSLFMQLQSAGIKINDNLLDHILKSEFVELINPITRFFQSLHSWDGTDYISEYINSCMVFSEPNEKNMLLIKKWLVGVVACATSKKTVNDLCLIFKGGQGIGKSTWFKRLLPAELEEYYTTFNISDKSNDTALSIISSLILDMDELNDLSKREDTEVKQLISQKQFKIRKPYDRLPDTYYRFASFCGSVNEDTFLKDATGHRRYIVLDVKSLDFDVIRTYDKRKIWSQAVGMLKAGFQFWLSQEENAELSNSNKKYEVVTPESELLTARFKPAADKDSYTHRFNTSQLLQFLDIKKLDQRAIKSMKNALREYGFESYVYWIDGKSQRLYALYELTKPLQ